MRCGGNVGPKGRIKFDACDTKPPKPKGQLIAQRKRAVVCDTTAIDTRSCQQARVFHEVARGALLDKGMLTAHGKPGDSKAALFCRANDNA